MEEIPCYYGRKAGEQEETERRKEKWQLWWHEKPFHTWWHGMRALAAHALAAGMPAAAWRSVAGAWHGSFTTSVSEKAAAFLQVPHIPPPNLSQARGRLSLSQQPSLLSPYISLLLLSLWHAMFSLGGFFYSCLCALLNPTWLPICPTSYLCLPSSVPSLNNYSLSLTYYQHCLFHAHVL